MSDDSDYDPDYVPSSESTCSTDSDGYSDSESTDEDVTAQSLHQTQRDRPVQQSVDSSGQWSIPTGSRQKQFPLAFTSGIKNIPDTCKTELDYYSLFVDDEIINLMVTMTNCYANKTMILKVLRRSSRLVDWKDCDQNEIKKFLGLLIWMGIKKLPKISDYWSKNILYKNPVAGSVMSRNRFELLLRCWHFEDTYFYLSSNAGRLIRVKRLVDLITKKFQNYNTPGEYLTVDETMVAFRGRIVFMQYIPGKKHKYGIKLFKICDENGYVHDLIVYEGKKTTPGQNLSKDVVMNLSEKYLDAGRSIVTDNFYTSVDLAKSLLNRSTHLLGTVRKNRRGLPKDIISTKLHKGEMIAKENDDGILVLKWKDKRDVLALSTKHSVGFVTVRSKRNRRKTALKPSVIAEYNKYKSAIDFSDQMGSYCNPLRRNVRWFQKLGIELLLTTSVVNAYLIYKSRKRLTTKTYTITKFRENLCIQLMDLQQRRATDPVVTKHEFGKNPLTDHRNRLIRRKCIHCYESLRQEGKSSVEAKKLTKKTSTVCLTCPTKPSVCASCFANKHSK
nr:piggyBac transposable element-derived protein 4-like [Maniola hyperantus]